MAIKKVILIIILIGFSMGLDKGNVVLEHRQAPNTFVIDKYQRSNEHRQFLFSTPESNHVQQTHLEVPRASIAQSDYLPSNLIVAYDNSHEPTVGQTAINLEGNLTAAGSIFTKIEGTFSIPEDTNVLIIPCSNATYTTDELNEIHDWFTSDGARLLWVAGDSDYAGYFNNTPSNDILTIVGSNLRISADTVYDYVYNDNASYRVAVQTPISDGYINSIITANVESAIFHGPTSVLGYQSGAVVDLNQTSIPGIEIIMKSSINATYLDSDFTGTELDYYSSNNLNGSYPMMAIQNMSDRKSVIASGEAIFSDYQHMYDLFTAQGKINNPYAWNGGFTDGKTLVDNVLAWFGRQAGANSPISISGDDEFRGFPGNGTLTNPYRIEGYSITESSGALISISGTTSYFTIKNNQLNGISTAGNGISIQNTGNGTIVKNSIYECQQGVALWDSSKNIIVNNTVFNNKYNGITLDSSDNNIITNNTIHDNFEESGIWIDQTSDNNTISNNFIYANNNDGIRLLTSSNYNTIINNTCYSNNWAGIRLQSANYNNTITNNTVYGNGFNGILIEGPTPSDNNTVVHNVVYSNLGHGIALWQNSSSNIIRNNTIYDNELRGIYVGESTNNRLIHNYIFNNGGYGILLMDSPNHYIKDNFLTDNGIYWTGPTFGSFIQTLVENNWVNGKPFVYWNGISGGTIPSGAGQIYLFDCTSVTISYQNLQNTSVGISADYCSSLTIQNNTVYNSRWGILIGRNTNETSIVNNTLYNNQGDIQLWAANNNMVTDNRLGEGSDYGIVFDIAEENLIANNTISETKMSGIRVLGGTGNSIEHNFFDNNAGYAIIFDDLSCCNHVRFNDFTVNNLGGVQALDNGTDNNIVYNYWSDWTSPDTDTDGFVDSPYAIDGIASNEDHHPLTSPNPLDSCLLFFLRVLYPNDGETVNGIINIQWSWPEDSYGHEVTFTVYYSDGGGWIQLASGLTTNTYSWDTNDVSDGSSYRIRVVATCDRGFTTEDTSDDTFTINNAVPATSSPPETTPVVPTTTTTTEFSSSIAPVEIGSPGMTGFLAILSLLPLLFAKKMKRRATKKPE